MTYLTNRSPHLEQRSVGETATRALQFHLFQINAITGERSSVDLSPGYSSITLNLQSIATENLVTADISSGKLAVVDEVNGLIEFYPDPNDFTYDDRLYIGYFIVVDLTNKRLRFPSDQNFELEVLKDF